MNKLFTIFLFISISFANILGYAQGLPPEGGLETGVLIVVSPNNIICAGTEVTFSAVPVSGGPAPYYEYQWQVNGVNAGQDDQQFITTTLNDGDRVQVIMTTNEPGEDVVIDSSEVITMSVDNTSTWTGAVNNSWEEPGNWSCNMVPFSFTNVIIPLTANLPLISSDSAVCNNIYIGTSASISISTGSILTVYGTMTNDGFPATGEGFVVFQGATQDLVGSVTINNLIVQAGSTTTLSGTNQEITGILLVNGTLNITGQLTLISTATATALIDGNSTGTINGTVVQQRYIAASKAKGYKQFSSAFSNATIGQFGDFMTLYLGNVNNTPYPTLYKYSEAAAVSSFGQGWVAAAPQGQVNTLIQPGIGYTAQFGSGGPVDNTTALYGNVNNGDISVPITKNNPGTIKGNGWNLVGNPYPSPIDLDKLPYTTANLNKNVSIFVSTSMYNGYYGYYNASFHLPLNGGTRYLPALHAFFVQCNNSAGGTLTFTNAMRYNKLNPQLYKEEEIPSFPMIKLAAGLIDEDAIKDETAIMFFNEASSNIENDYDVSKLWNSDPLIPNIYTIASNEKLAMNSLNSNFDEIKEIPLGFAAETSGIYKIEAEDIINIEPSVSVILQDLKLNKAQDLKSNTEYVFSADQAEQAEGRFIIKVGKNTINSVDETCNSAVFSAWYNGESLSVNIFGQKSNKGQIEVFDSYGRNVFNANVNTDGSYQFNPGLSTGTYIVRYFNGEDIAFTKLFIR